MRFTLQRKTGIVAIVILFVLFIISGTLMGLLGHKLSEILYSLNLPIGVVDLSSDVKIRAFRFFQFFSNLGTFVIPALVFNYVFLDKDSRLWSIAAVSVSKVWIYSVLGLICLMPIIFQLYEWNKMMSLPDFLSELEGYLQKEESLRDMCLVKLLSLNTGIDLLINILLLCVLAAIGEELFFRGACQGILLKLFKQKHFAIIITALIFAFMHFQFYGFLPRLLMGLVLGYLMFWTSNIVLVIVIHFLFNFSQIMIYHFWSNYLTEIFAELPWHSIWLIQIIAIILLILFSYRIRIHISK